MKKNSLIIFFLLFFYLADCQQFEWQVGLEPVLDNREYFNDVIFPQTIFGVRTFGEIGASLDTIHHLRVGLSDYYEFGSALEDHKPQFIFYYRYDKKPLLFMAGVLPRALTENYPRALLNDTLLYYRPYLEGMYFSFSGNWGYQNVWIDWTSRQTDVRRETFLAGASGTLKRGIFYFSYHALMFHRAGYGIRLEGDRIRDNLAFTARVGLDLSEKTPFDILKIYAGGILSHDRLRGIYEQAGQSLIAGIHAKYRWAGVNALINKGSGHEIVWGDNFYRADYYARTDFYVRPIDTEHVKIEVSLNFHFLEGNIDSSQKIAVRICFGSGS